MFSSARSITLEGSLAVLQTELLRRDEIDERSLAGLRGCSRSGTQSENRVRVSYGPQKFYVKFPALKLGQNSSIPSVTVP